MADEPKAVAAGVADYELSIQERMKKIKAELSEGELVYHDSSWSISRLTAARYKVSGSGFFPREINDETLIELLALRRIHHDQVEEDHTRPTYKVTGYPREFLRSLLRCGSPLSWKFFAEWYGASNQYNIKQFFKELILPDDHTDRFGRFPSKKEDEQLLDYIEAFGEELETVFINALHIPEIYIQLDYLAIQILHKVNNHPEQEIRLGDLVSKAPSLMRVLERNNVAPFEPLIERLGEILPSPPPAYTVDAGPVPVVAPAMDMRAIQAMIDAAVANAVSGLTDRVAGLEAENEALRRQVEELKADKAASEAEDEAIDEGFQARLDAMPDVTRLTHVATADGDATDDDSEAEAKPVVTKTAVPA